MCDPFSLCYQAQYISWYLQHTGAVLFSTLVSCIEQSALLFLLYLSMVPAAHTAVSNAGTGTCSKLVHVVPKILHDSLLRLGRESS